MLMRIRVGNLEDYRKDKRIIYWLTRGISEYGIYYSWATDKVNRWSYMNTIPGTIPIPRAIASSLIPGSLFSAQSLCH